MDVYSMLTAIRPTQTIFDVFYVIHGRKSPFGR